MKTLLKNFSFVSILALGAAVTGCAADAPGTGGGGGGGGGDGSGSGSDQVLDATGKYSLQSSFDISANMPGTVGVVVNDFIAATDDPADPTQWVLQQIVAQLPNGTAKTLLNGAIPFVSGYLNDRLLDWAPDFVTTIVQVGNDFGDMAKHFGLNETLDVTKAGADYASTVTALGAHFKIDTQEMDLKFADYQVPNVVAMNVGVQLDMTGKLTIADHKLPLSYGKILRIGLDAAIIPMIDSSAANLGQLLADKIDCATVGQYINDAIVSQFGFGPGAGTMQAACTAGLQFGANAIYQKISAIDSSALEFNVNGTAKVLDTNHDYKPDQIQTGKWAGTLSYGGTPAPLATATFTGARM
jgi:hypothetical protein